MITGIINHKLEPLLDDIYCERSSFRIMRRDEKRRTDLPGF
jgi:hypothetical protein